VAEGGINNFGRSAKTVTSTGTEGLLWNKHKQKTFLSPQGTYGVEMEEGAITTKAVALEPWPQQVLKVLLYYLTSPVTFTLHRTLRYL